MLNLQNPSQLNQQVFFRFSFIFYIMYGYYLHQLTKEIVGKLRGLELELSGEHLYQLISEK